MSWNDFYRRRDALDEVLRHARQNPEGTLPYDEIPEVAEVFSGPDEVLLALHHRWTMKLTGRVNLAQAEAERDRSVNLIDAIIQAWRATAVENPVLRWVLDANADAYADTLRPAIEAEQRMLALAAGLCEPDEPRAEITRVGGAFAALVRSAPERSERRRNPVELLLRRLVASA
ncbi:hypothetical protein [Actinokineospora iranica]|uniref:Uncharacterized protein n=1 Tax=Actinokineospora iranica TaxID=1271860 RepID=A0A1G6MXG9_9PSEU|nr:hypothetical protein [Actinokineospora iranica]SDC59934.1 hypothetical protein SAMN05216174_10370 [Actinokineospora iranica]